MDVHFLHPDGKGPVFISISVRPQMTPVCRQCQSPNIRFVATAMWDSTTEGYTLDAVMDTADCNDCGHTGTRMKKSITPPSTSRKATVEDTAAYDKTWARFLEANPSAKSVKLPKRPLTEREKRRAKREGSKP